MCRRRASARGIMVPARANSLESGRQSDMQTNPLGHDPTVKPSSAAMFAAERAGDVDEVRRLLNGDRSLVADYDEHGKTPLHVAAETNNAEIIDILVAAGADIEARSGWGATALDWAAVMNAQAAAQKLNQRGARLTLVSAAGLGLLDEVKSFWIGPRELSPAAASSPTAYDD